jgi:hypothetical protein
MPHSRKLRFRPPALVAGSFARGLWNRPHRLKTEPVPLVAYVLIIASGFDVARQRNAIIMGFGEKNNSKMYCY